MILIMKTIFLALTVTAVDAVTTVNATAHIGTHELRGTSGDVAGQHVLGSATIVSKVASHLAFPATKSEKSLPWTSTTTVPQVVNALNVGHVRVVDVEAKADNVTNKTVGTDAIVANKTVLTGA